MSHLLHRTLGLATVVALVVACSPGGSDGSPSTAPTGPGSTTTTTTVADAMPPIAVDWHARTVDGGTEVDVDGWSIRFCDGQAPFLCLAVGERDAGTVELLGVDASVLDAHNGDVARWATAFVDDVAADRAATCGPDVSVAPDPPVSAVVADGDGLRYAFTTTRAGQAVERAVGHAVVVGDRLWLIVADAQEERSCVGRDGAEMTLADLAALEPVLGRVAAGSVLPDGAP